MWAVFCISLRDLADRGVGMQFKFAADTTLEEAVSTVGRIRVQYDLRKLEMW